MDIKYLNPFLGSFFNILPQFGITDIKKTNLSVKGKVIESPGIVIIIGIIGDVKGNVLYATTEECAKKIASAMMMGMPVNEFDEIAQSALSELTNMLTATAATYLSNDGIHVNISTPTLLLGSVVANTNSNQTICIDLLANNMPFQINIAFE